MSRFDLVVDTLFESDIGFDAVYTPAGAVGFPIRVIPNRSDEFSGFSEVTIQSRSAVFDVRAAQVPNPARGDRIEYDGVVYVVQNSSYGDSDRMIWKVDTHPL